MATATREQTRISPDRVIFDLKSVGTPRTSHDGSRIAYILGGIERGTAKSVSHLWTMNADGSDSRQLTREGTSTSDPAWSPDDTAIAFVSNRGGKSAICVLPLDGGEARVVTSHAQKPGALVWSPDGTRLAYTVPVDPENPEEAERDADAPPAVRVIRRIDYKQDNRGFLNDVRHQVMVVDVESGERKPISAELKDHSFPQWSPDGSTIAAKVSDKNGMHSVLSLFPVDGGDATTFGWDDDGGIGTFAWSRDGSFILFNGYPVSSPQTEYYRYDVASGDIRQLTDDLAFSPESGFPTISGPAQPIWLDDATALVHGVQEGASGLWTVNTESGERSEVARWEATHAGLSVDDAGKTVVQGRADTSGLGKLVRHDLASGETTILLDPNEAFFAESRAAQVEKITIDRDGWSIDAWISKPADFDPSQSYPIVMDVHGGPHGNHGFAFNVGDQVLASNGYIVVSPNPRGSGTYGREFGEAVRGDWGGEDWKDLLAVLDHVLQEPWADETRTGIYGYSYGGYMTSWAIGQTNRFKAVVCGAPVFNLASFYGTSDIGHAFGENQWGGSPLDPDVARFMEERSPSNHVHKAVTPTLIVHGEADDRCPIGQGEEMFVGLLKAGCETEFVRYPGGSHLMLRGGPAQHRVDFYTRILTWFDRYLQ
jgi:dipeptidyl aminopeptidase/acylaminoacyl peptidase